jgi:hypothetical protein
MANKEVLPTMGNQNSLVVEKFIGLFREMLSDFYVTSLPLKRFLPIHVPDREIERDIRYVVRRTGSEGIEFITRTLPKLGDYIDGRLGGKDVSFPEGFKPLDKKNKRSRFLRIMWDVLDLAIDFENSIKAGTGTVRLSDPPAPKGSKTLPPSIGITLHEKEALVRSIKIIRTIVRIIKKLDLTAAGRLQQLVVKAFKEVEKDLKNFSMPPDNRIAEMARHVLDDVLSGFYTRDKYSNVLKHIYSPKHGPGAVATGECDEEKWKFSNLYKTLHARFPYYDFMY